MRPALAGSLVAAAAWAGALSGCGVSAPGPCAHASAFALSLASGAGGQPSPVAAATWFAGHNGGVVAVPDGGWRLLWRGTHTARVRSGSFTLHVLQGSDGSWQVDSGKQCG